MELTQLLNAFFALALVLALMGLLALFAKKLGLSQRSGTSKSKRLTVIEDLPLDHKRKAILLQRDDKEHLVILGPNSETVIETKIKPKESESGKDDTPFV